MNSMLLNRLLKSMQIVDNENIEIDFKIFVNSHNYDKPIVNLPHTTIDYIYLEEDNFLKIASARDFLQQKIYDHCIKNKIKPIVWLLDEDIEIDNRANKYLPRLVEFKNKGYDVLIGSIDGDSPNASFSGISLELFDLIKNLEWLESMDENELLPSREKLNQALREKYPNYYYDLSSDKDKSYRIKPFWITPIKNQECVKEAKERIYLHLVDILSGKNFFRSIIQPQINEYKKTLLRGANTFILNLDSLKVRQPIIRVDDRIIRRSDMLWALANQEFFGSKIIKVDFSIWHKRDIKPTKELTVEKSIDELSGSIVFNSLRLFYENNQEMAFEEILKHQIRTKIEAIKESFQRTKKYIRELKSFGKSELTHFCQQLEDFYTEENLNLMINQIEMIYTFRDKILNKFISYKPSILNSCDLTTSYYGVFKQYDLGDDNIKILSKKPIEEMDKNSPPLVRVHSSCCNSEVFHANDCDCAKQLEKSMRIISKQGDGIIFYLNQEGRGHGYSNKIAIVGKMQKESIDTYQSCKALGLEKDIREYKRVGELLREFSFNKIRLLSNNPKKIEDIEKSGIEIIRKKIIGSYTKQNIDYLKSKQQYGGHKKLIITQKLLIERYKPLADSIEFYEKEDEYGVFSNFSDHPFVLDKKYWRTSEHYYQANKFEPFSKIYNSIQQAKTATIAKNIAHSHQIDESWEERKILFMYNALYEKFIQNNGLIKLLLSTKSAYIIEKAIDDEFWGSGREGKGKNMLGRVLMFLRDAFKEEIVT